MWVGLPGIPRGIAVEELAPIILRWALLLVSTTSCITPAEEGAEFEEAINPQANPEVDHRPQIHSPRAVLRGRRQVWRKRKIQGITQQDGNEEL